MRAALSDWLALLFVVALFYLLLRPSSKAAELVDAVGKMLVTLVRRATDIVA